MLQIHVSVDGMVVCSPLSLLPQLKVYSDKPVEEALLAIADVDMPKTLEELKPTDVECKQWDQSERSKLSTRQKLLSINLSLKTLINMKLVDCFPVVPLRHPTATEKLCYTDEAQPRGYYFDVCSRQVTWQTCRHDSFPKHVRLCALADEGDHSAALCLAEAGCAVLPFRDCQHKLAREECLSMGDVTSMDVALKEVLLVLKHDAAPWKQGMFGRRLREAYQYIDQLPVPHLLIDLVMGGIIADRGLSPNTGQAEIKQLLCDYARGQGRGGGDHKLGRWADFVDTFGRERKNWNVKLFFLLFAKSLEGLNPFTAIAQATAKDGEDEDMAIAPRVLRATLTMHTPSTLCFG